MFTTCAMQTINNILFVQIWSEKNFLRLNKDKTVALSFTLSPQISDALTLFKNSLNDIRCSRSTKT